MNLLGTDFRKNMLGYDSHPDDNNTREARWRMGEKKDRLTAQRGNGSQALVCAN